MQAAAAKRQMAFNILRWIVTVGWSIYPIGYIVGYAVARPMPACSTSSTTMPTLLIKSRLASLSGLPR